MEFILNIDNELVQDYSCFFRSVHIEKSYPCIAGLYAVSYNG